MINIISRPHMRQAMRGIPEAKRKAIQYATDKRREEQGKTVIYLHEQPPRPRCSMPTDAEAGPMIRDFFQAHGYTPARLVAPFKWDWIDAGFAVTGLPPHADDLSGRYGRTGRWVSVHVIYDPDAEGLRFE